MRHADEMNERIAVADRFRVGIFLERIGDDWQDIGWKLLLRSGPDDRSNLMLAFRQQRNEPAANVTGPAGDADRGHGLILERPDFASHFEHDAVAFDRLIMAYR